MHRDVYYNIAMYVILPATTYKLYVAICDRPREKGHIRAM